LSVSRGQRAWLATRRALSSWKVDVGVIGLGVFIVLAVIGPFIAPYDPDATSNARLQGPSAAHLLGTTLSGQDVLSQFLVGAGPSLFIGFLAALVATALSVIFGLLSAYLRGIVGESMTFISNVFLVLPALPLLIVIGAYLPNTNFTVLALVIGLTSWAWGARVVRAQVLSLKARDYILAARAAGEGVWRILVYEVMPGLIPVITATFLFTVALAILTEAGLAFLGLGDVTKWTWGTMLYWTQNDNAYLLGAWWWYIPPGLAIALIGAFMGLINYGLDEFANARLRDESRRKMPRSRRLRPMRRRPAPGPRTGSETAPGDTVLSIEHLSVELGRSDPIRAVEDVTIPVPAGKILGIAGESGCGKSTLLNTIARILPASASIASGAILYRPGSAEPVDVLKLEGEPLRRLRWAKVAIVTQAAMNALNPVMDVEKQITDVLAAHGFGASRTERRRRVLELLSMVGIPADRLRAFPHELSGGMRQRVMIAMALALSPDILLLDEPTTALDVVTQRQIVNEVLKIRERLGISIVFVTHDLSLLLETADRVAIMYAGKVVEIAASADIRRGAAHPYTRALLVSMPMLHGNPDFSEHLRGTPPNMRSLPPGCRFAPRCKHADTICTDREPALLRLSDSRGLDHEAACHHSDIFALSEVAEPQAVTTERTLP
jgi:peptide/nickel transport system permease protein